MVLPNSVQDFGAMVSLNMTSNKQPQMAYPYVVLVNKRIQNSLLFEFMGLTGYATRHIQLLLLKVHIFLYLYLDKSARLMNL